LIFRGRKLSKRETEKEEWRRGKGRKKRKRKGIGKGGAEIYHNINKVLYCG
jgi:hypothetical protein